MTPVFNFSAGPAMLPVDVMREAQAEFLDYAGSGMSVMELSHRGALFIEIARRAEQDLRDLLNIPENYRVLFLQGGATTQFGMIPLNLLRGKSTADYFCTGAWSQKAIKEAQRFCHVNVVASDEANNFTSIPEPATWQYSGDAAYVHYCPNETIHGVAFPEIPETNDIALVADMSSCILSAPIDVSRFGLIYAGAQKNIGPAGLSIVIIRDDLLGHCEPRVPGMLDYQAHAKNDSMLNTPPTFAWYLAGKVFNWLKHAGGVAAIHDINRRKAQKLYAAIDRSAFYANPVAPPCRSIMNIPFTLADNALDAQFLREAEAAGLTNLQGHRSVGGMRASLYNAMPEAGVDALLAFMADFEKQHG